MESRVKIAGHPVHQMLIPFPLGLLATAVIFDIVWLITGTAVFETARRGSTPRRAAKRFTSSGCAGWACNPAKVEVQVRFLARTLDARARRYGDCLQSSIRVGSTPTGVSW